MWIHRKEHFRNANASPERSRVAATIYYRPDGKDAPPRQGWAENCPVCGAPIRVSKPSHGGTFVSEVLPSGRHIPHPCFDRMKGKRPSDETLDLFEWQPPN
ncbi:hypothetical protein HPO_16755 [Hyphomonas polymorpha PS728]|uniref:Uncharacterized protein n=1 Tax=Hyphomonas polymorpha PS728 TaxID=1280954 RepID=A0A062VG80_9PROT|nr:hypothetical protein [Hyphomonas polymorpha]KCZ97045.1 hypothetical protein HPO_16755 [Hyphomonas polymorpha PS728]